MATEAVKTDITLAVSIVLYVMCMLLFEFVFKVVHDVEENLESMRIAAEAARKKLDKIKLQWRLKRKELENGTYLVRIITY